MSTELLPVTPSEPDEAELGLHFALALERMACVPAEMGLHYIDGIRPPTTPSLFLGKVVHRILRAFIGICRWASPWKRPNCPTHPGICGRIVDDENMKFDSAAQEQSLQRQAKDLVAAYIGYAPQDEKPLAVEVAAEAPLIDPFTGEDLGLPMLGIMDLILDGQEAP